MRYTVTTFSVRLEVCQLGVKTLNSEDAERIARGIYRELDADKEHFVMLALAAVKIICVHNHPSDDPMPSQEDFELTKRIKECGEMMELRILDHIILGTDRICSFSDKGVL